MMTPAVRVRPAEAELLAVARALVTPDGYASIEPTLALANKLGKKLGPSAMRVLTDTLAKGTVKMLARLGGAAARVRPGSGTTEPTRVFETRAAPRIDFGPYSFELLRWLATAPLGSSNVALFDATPVTLGDELCAYFTLRLVEGRRFERAVASAPGLRCGLGWVGFARILARYGGAPPERLDALVASEGANMDALVDSADHRVVLECIEGDLASRWASSAVWDAQDTADAEQAARLGRAERAVLDGFLAAVERGDRWDLATFLIEAGTRALPPGRTPQQAAALVTPRIPTGTLRARTEARRQSGALFHALGRIRKKRDALALVRFIDEGYASAQATLSSWETMDRETFARAQRVVAELDSLDGGAVETAREG